MLNIRGVPSRVKENKIASSLKLILSVGTISLKAIFWEGLFQRFADEQVNMKIDEIPLERYSGELNSRSRLVLMAIVESWRKVSGHSGKKGAERGRVSMRGYTRLPWVHRPTRARSQIGTHAFYQEID